MEMLIREVSKLTKNTSADRMAKDSIRGVKSEERGTFRYRDYPQKRRLLAVVHRDNTES